MTVPANSTATVELPQGSSAVTVNGEPVATYSGTETMATRNGRAAFQVGSGCHQFAYTMV